MFFWWKTEPGRLMARYCIAFDTMKRFSKLGPDGSISELVNIEIKPKKPPSNWLKIIQILFSVKYWFSSWFILFPWKKEKYLKKLKILRTTIDKFFVWCDIFCLTAVAFLYVSLQLYELCGCEEFAEVQLRNNEKKILNTFNKDKNRVTVRWGDQTNSD